MADSDRDRIEAACRTENAEDLLQLATDAAERIGDHRVHATLLTLSRMVTVEMSHDRPTAWIGLEGGGLVLRFNPCFFLQYHGSGEEVLHTVLHELMHHVQGDFHRRAAPEDRHAANIAADLLVNRTLHRQVFHRGQPYFESLYRRDRLLPAIMLSPEQLGLGEGGDVEKAAFDVFMTCDDVEEDRAHLAAELHARLWYADVTFAWLLERVRELIDGDETRVEEIGGHGDEGEGAAWERLREALRGLGGGTLGGVLHPERTRVEERRIAAFAEAVRRALVPDMRDPRRNLQLVPDRGVVPSSGRRETYLLAAGIEPLFYPCPIPTITEEEQAVRLYVDVSGSTESDWPMILGMIVHIRRELSEPIYLFSTQVVEASLSQLQEGNIWTTGGTDFDLVLRHILDHGFRRALLVTDGQGRVSPPVAQRTRAARVDLLALLTTATVDPDLQVLLRAYWSL